MWAEKVSLKGKLGELDREKVHGHSGGFLAGIPGMMEVCKGYHRHIFRDLGPAHARIIHQNIVQIEEYAIVSIQHGSGNVRYVLPCIAFPGDEDFSTV